MIKYLLIILFTLPLFASDDIIKIIEEEAFNELVPPQLLLAICKTESSLKPYVTNFDDGSKGINSHGLCQLQFRTAQSVGFKEDAKLLYDPRINARYAAKYLKKHLKKYGWVWNKAIAAYNAGRVIYDKQGEFVNKDYVEKVRRKLYEWEKCCRNNRWVE